METAEVLLVWLLLFCLCTSADIVLYVHIDIPPKADLVFDIQLMKINDVDLAASYLVKELPRLKPGLLDLMSLYAGHVQVAEEWKYFYILVKEKIKTPVVVSKKLMFWFNGG